MIKMTKLNEFGVNKGELKQLLKDATYVGMFNRQGTFLGYWDGFNKESIIESYKIGE